MRKSFLFNLVWLLALISACAAPAVSSPEPTVAPPTAVVVVLTSTLPPPTPLPTATPKTWDANSLHLEIQNATNLAEANGEEFTADRFIVRYVTSDAGDAVLETRSDVPLAKWNALYKDSVFGVVLPGCQLWYVFERPGNQFHVASTWTDGDDKLIGLVVTQNRDDAINLFSQYRYRPQ